MDPTKKELYVAKRPSGVNTEDPAIQEGWDRVRNDEDNSATWLLLSLNNTVVSVKSVGAGIDEFISQLNDDEILFGGIRASINDQTKFFHVYFVGSNVEGMKKGKASLYESGIFQVLEGCGGKIQLSNGLQDVTKDEIISRIRGVTKVADAQVII